jgi:predicted XRE-type DNA-binding protein
VLKIKSGLAIDIKVAIRDLGLSQQEAAERMGISAEQLASLAHSGFATFAEQDLRTWLARLKEAQRDSPKDSSPETTWT